MKELKITTNHHDQLVDITSQIAQLIDNDYTGGLLLYVPHTSAAVMINEGADPDVQTDILGFLSELIPWEHHEFDHMEGNSAAHIKAMLIGNDQLVIVENGQLQLGTWEKIFFCEFDGPRSRRIWVSEV